MDDGEVDVIKSFDNGIVGQLVKLKWKCGFLHIRLRQT